LSSKKSEKPLVGDEGKTLGLTLTHCKHELDQAMN